MSLDYVGGMLPAARANDKSERASKPLANDYVGKEDPEES
jgi:hypothetical protein